MRFLLYPFLSLFVFLTLFADKAHACSMYKLTADGKTMVGNNEDSWGQDARIWFEPGSGDQYGVVCLGYARKYPRPDGAMNEHGLVFDAFSMPHKAGMPERDPAKKDFSYAQLTTIMQSCKTVDDVYDWLKDLNLHALNGSILFHGGMLLFTDKSGKYLVVEAGQMTFGNEASFVLANFSVADTKDLGTVKIERYCKGVDFLKTKELHADLPFCMAMSDTMSVNRARVGDGTLYTSIYDLENGIIHLYFFHDFTRSISFNLQEELAKGVHFYEMAELFPDNRAYQHFLNHKTPQNSTALFGIVLGFALLFLFTSIYFFISFFRNRTTRFRVLKLMLSLCGLLFFIYTVVLLRNEGIFYFPAPYKNPHSVMLSLTSYLPFLAVLLIIPGILVLRRIFREKAWKEFARYLFAANCIALFILIGLFAYWQLFGF